MNKDYQPSVEEVRAVRENTGMGVLEARRMLQQTHVLQLLDKPLWFLHIREILKYLVARN